MEVHFSKGLLALHMGGYSVYPLNGDSDFMEAHYPTTAQVRVISSMSYTTLPWEFSIAWIADKESKNITVSVRVELSLSNCCILYKGVKGFLDCNNLSLEVGAV